VRRCGKIAVATTTFGERGRKVAVNVTIDAGSKADAELIAQALPGAEARSWRGYGVIRLRLQSRDEARAIAAAVRSAVEAHALAWARVRVGDDEEMIRRNGRSTGGRTGWARTA
jgi:hypothetical protein